MPIRSVLILLLCIAPTIFSFGQNRRAIDSLLKESRVNPSDSLKIEALNDLVWEYYGIINDSALYFAKRAINMAEQKQVKTPLGNAHRYAGLVYERLANYPKGLYHQQRALRIYEKIKFKPGIANCYNNMAVIYKSLSDFEKALEYQKKALDLCIEIDQKPGVAACYGNLGNIYKQLNNIDTALIYYLKAYEFDSELGNQYGIGVSLVNIGSIYLQKKEFEKALEYLNKSIEVRKKIGSTQGLAISYNTLGDLYIEIKNMFKAQECFELSLKYAKESGALESEKDAYNGLYQISKKKNDITAALSHYENYVKLKDSIFNSKKNEELSTLKMKFALEKQESELKEKSDEEKRIMRERSELEKEKSKQEHFRDQLIIFAVAVVLIIVLLFSVFLYNRFKVISKQKIIIEEKKSEVEEKNKQITDSINYAKRIQEALLPQENDLKKIFPESFVFFQPKDIVSGDFYWLHTAQINNDEILFITVADCTGHGVPGGFMSMLGTSFLNEIVVEKKIHEPSKVLNHMREKVIAALKQKEDEESAKDGMDMVFLKINKTKNRLSYAAANNGFYIIKNSGLLNEYNPDKMPIAVFDHMPSFQEHEIDLEKNDTIILYSDGYADQFGGPDFKKFKYNRLEEILASMANLNSFKQKEELVYQFKDWKGDVEQIDDVSIIGIKI